LRNPNSQRGVRGALTVRPRLPRDAPVGSAEFGQLWGEHGPGHPEGVAEEDRGSIASGVLELQALRTVHNVWHDALLTKLILIQIQLNRRWNRGGQSRKTPTSLPST
jgi:hypothetical protein